MPAELGQTNDPKELIPGEPGLISNDLRQLVGTMQGVDGIGGALSKVDPAQWTGAASSAFRTAFGAEPPKWTAAVSTLGKAGQALADYGDVLTWGQGEAQRAIELYTQAQAATRAAASQYDAQAAQAGGAGMAPFQDPGQAAAQNAQAILDNARQRVGQTGDETAAALGFKSDKEFGADKRQKVSRWDPATGKWVEEDPGGWQKTKGGRSFEAEWGSQSDGLLTDKIGDTLKELGIDLPEATATASAGVDVLGGKAEGGFDSGPLSGHGEVDGALLGADAQAHASASPLGVTAGASAEAYLAKGSAEGDLSLGKHASVSGTAEGMVGADGEAEGTIGLLGAQGEADAFAGAKVSGDATAEVAGVSAGAHGEAWAGAGAEASGQFGMGDDGKFHIGASVGAALGIGGKIGFNVSVDPGEVVNTAGDVAKDLGHTAEDVGSGTVHAAQSAGKAVLHAFGL